MADNSTRIVIDAVDKTKAAIDSVKGNLTGLAGTAGTLNGTLARLAPLLGAATFTAFIKNSIDAADSLNDLSARTGAAVEDLAGLELAAKLGDTSLEALGKGINRLSIFMAENSQRAKELGITAKDPVAALVQLSEKLTSIQDLNTRNSVANEILGKSYQELLPLLLQGGAALQDQINRGKELNPITEEMARQAGMFNDQLDELAIGSKAFGLSIAKDLLPSLNELIEDMAEAYREGGLLQSFFVGIGTLGKNALFGSDYKREFQRATIGIPAEIVRLQTQLQNDINKSKPLSFVDRKRIEIEMRDLAKEQNNLRRKLKLDEPVAPPKATGGEDDTSVKGSAGKDPIQTLKEQIALQQAQNNLVAQGVPLEDARTIAKLKQQGISDELIVQQLNLNQITQQLADQEKARTDAKTKADKEALDSQKQMQDAMKKGDEERAEYQREIAERQQAGQKTLDDALAAIQAESDELQFQITLQGLSKKMQAEKISERNVEIALQKTLNELQANGLYLSEEEIEALREKYAQIEKTKGKLSETNNTAKDIGLTLKSALEDAIVSGEKFSDVLKGLEQDLIRLLTRRTVTDPLMKGIDGLLEGFDINAFIPGIADFFANANGNAFNQAGVMPFAKGGIVNRATPFMFANGGRLGVMGEAGPEAILPLRRGANGQLGVQSGGRDSMPIVNVNIIGAPSQPQVSDVRDDGNGNMSIDVIFDAIKGSLTKDIRSEGTFAQTLQGQYGLNRAAGAR
jgi:hypothetical protein